MLPGKAALWCERFTTGHHMDGNISPPEDTQAADQPSLWSREGRRELLMFLALAVLIWPFIAVGVVAGWGFVVWMYYLFTGPPGPV